MTVAIEHRYPGKLPDTGNCFNTAKACIDAFTRAGLMTDDSPKYLDFMTFLPPRKVEKQDEGLAFCFDVDLQTAILRLETLPEDLDMMTAS